jgi:hypothetical protein
MIFKKIPALAVTGFALALVYRCLVARRSFAGKMVVITGGSRGLGLALARRLARQQADLAIIARDEEELARARSDLAGYGSIVTTWPCDLRREAELRSTIQEIGKRFGKIDMPLPGSKSSLVHFGPDRMAPGLFYWPFHGRPPCHPFAHWPSRHHEFCAIAFVTSYDL